MFTLDWTHFTDKHHFPPISDKLGSHHSNLPTTLTTKTTYQRRTGHQWIKVESLKHDRMSSEPIRDTMQQISCFEAFLSDTISSYHGNQGIHNSRVLHSWNSSKTLGHLLSLGESYIIKGHIAEPLDRLIPLAIRHKVQENIR